MSQSKFEKTHFQIQIIQPSQLKIILHHENIHHSFLIRTLSKKTKDIFCVPDALS